MATKIMKTQRKSVFSKNIMTENPESTPFATQGSPNLIREGSRTAGSGRVAAVIERLKMLAIKVFHNGAPFFGKILTNRSDLKCCFAKF